MRPLCSQETLALRRKKTRRHTVVFGVMCLLTLLVFLAGCLLTRTGNAAVMLRITYAGMILMGFACIVFFRFVLSPSRRMQVHLEGLLSREPAVLEGRFFLTGAAFRIPGSVQVRAVRLEADAGPVSLNLDEDWISAAPPDGSLVRLQAVRKFITGIEVMESAAMPARPSARRKRHPVRQLLSLFPSMVLWVMFVLMFGGFVFNQITDAPPENKIVIYADCDLRNAPQLAEVLEKELNGAVRMVKIHPFSYAMFDTARISLGDLYLVPDSRKEEYRRWFLSDEGVVMYNPDAGFAAADACFLYTPEVYRLYTGAGSVHLKDGLASRTAELLLSMRSNNNLETQEVNP